MLGAVCSHRETGKREDTLSLLRLLTDEQQQVLVVTSAPGLGADRSSTCNILFVWQVWRLRDQGRSSRGALARYGAPAKRPSSEAPNGKRRVGGRFRDIEVEVHEIVTTRWTAIQQGM
jgi:hypothetical protein